jgi:hypothetical protein
LQPAQQSLLYEIGRLRANALRAQEEGPIPPRVASWCEAARSWARLQWRGQRFYSAVVTDALFELQAGIEEDPEANERERAITELSLWDVAVALELVQDDPQASRFIAIRRERLLTLLADKGNDLQALCASCALLLRYRANPIRQLPGEYQTDADTLVVRLSNLGLPRRARAIAQKFRVELDAVGKFALRHRSVEEEEDRTCSLVRRLNDRMPVIPYGAIRLVPALRAILVAPVSALPISIDGVGRIAIANQAFGVTQRPY